MILVIRKLVRPTVLLDQFTELTLLRGKFAFIKQRTRKPSQEQGWVSVEV